MEWARIEPEEGRFDTDTIAHYRDVLETCHRYGIAPMVTYRHFTSPRWLLADGGWENPRTPERFARYCEVVTRELGDLYEIAFTLNEPNLPFLLGALGLGARTAEDRRQMPMFVNAAAELGVDAATIAPFMFTGTPAGYGVKLAAHRLGRDAIASVRPGIAVGWTLANSDIQGTRGSERLAAELRAGIKRPLPRGVEGRRLRRHPDVRAARVRRRRSAAARSGRSAGQPDGRRDLPAGARLDDPRGR
jgi:beta-glucosidase